VHVRGVSCQIRLLYTDARTFELDRDSTSA
jgi:hypothetical protein